MKVVYTTNTGSTKRYAQMLSEKLSCDCIDLNDAEAAKAAVGEEIVYLGWVMASQIQGLPKARELYGSSIKAVCAVGMLGQKNEDELIKKNAVNEKFFALAGCFDVERLTGMYKMMMKMMLGTIKKQLKSSTDPADAKVLEMLENGIDMVKEENLDGVLKFLNGESADETDE